MPSKRSVSELTPQELFRKRFNDRRAQRAIRARNKENIQRLQTELEMLRQKDTENERIIHATLRHKKMLREELEDFRNPKLNSENRMSFTSLENFVRVRLHNDLAMVTTLVQTQSTTLMRKVTCFA